MQNLQPMGSRLTQAEKDIITQMVCDNDDLVSMGLQDLPICNGTPMEIPTGEAPPCRQKMRPEPLLAQEFTRETIQGLLDNGLIKRSRSPWASPISIAPKNVKPGSGKWPWRFCCDFRRLNQMTLKEATAMPRISDMVAYTYKYKYKYTRTSTRP